MITKQQLINSVLEYYNNNKDCFNEVNYIKHGYSESTIVKHYGSWSNLCEELNLPYRKRNLYTKEEILDDIKTVIINTNNTTRDNYAKYGKFSKCAYERYVGKWTYILDILGYTSKSHKSVCVPKQKVIDEILKLNDKYNGYLTAEIQRKECKYGQRMIDAHFGSFSNMVKELNLRVPDGKSITNNEIIENIQHIYNSYGVISCKILDEHCIVSTPTVINRFGSIQQACCEANVEYSDTWSKFAKYTLNLCNSILNEKAKTEHKFPWLINPKTKRHLRVDAFYQNHNLVIEFDGPQHETKQNFMTEQEFVNGKYRDNIKDTLIPQNNIKFLRIPYHYTVEQIVNSVNSVTNKG